MTERALLKNILKAGKIANELELERALVLDRKLRLLAKENSALADSRKSLRTIIQSYEKAHWSEPSKITDAQISDSELAEIIAEQERLFIENRRAVIKKKLDQAKLTQQDLGKLLGHGKTYMSELMNGISPFSLRDLIIIHRIFNIKLEKLIPTTISASDTLKLKHSLAELNKPKLARLQVG